ncbi:DNA topology modulation protein FlaR [Amycolatopsis anabasis]|uniref:DNA topology modulation protein FlaR n=1 Tax=Amycolatopsis anabasis TaxID=1840409 RepID=UPI00131C31B3|nr:DNA topology modulation protein FlaR [Amycolatopsis anabasis]
MRRIAVIGCGGAGKSTFSRRLGEILGLPVTHLDRLFWRPGWVPTERAEWRRIQRGLVAADRWILDGNYGGTMDIRLAAADTVILLDFPRRTCLRRALRRTIRGGEQAPGCPERFDPEFLRWIWTWPHAGRRRMFAHLAEHGGGTRQILLSSPREAAAYLARVRSR